MHLTFKRDWRGYREGQTTNVPATIARAALAVGAADHASNEKARASERVETAVRRAPENAAERTEAPEPRYQGYGWWSVGDAKVQAPEDADPEDVLRKADDG